MLRQRLTNLALISIETAFQPMKKMSQCYDLPIGELI